MTRRSPAIAPEVEVVAGDDIPPSGRSEAKAKVGALVALASEPVLRARVRLSRSRDPAVARPVIAQGNLDLNGRLLRVQVTADNAHEAVALLETRLRRRLGQMARHWEARRGARPEAAPYEWRHSKEPTHRPDYFPRPEQQRRVVRHKTYEPARTTPEEAAFDLDMLDHDFQLFTDSETGQDSVIYHAGPTGYRLAQLTPDPPRTRSTAPPLTVSQRPAPRLTLAEAVHRLNAMGLPFLFFAEPASGRGRVLYRRYDGHYGLITPAS
jgi:hypothetical protein